MSLFKKYGLSSPTTILGINKVTVVIILAVGFVIGFTVILLFNSTRSLLKLPDPKQATIIYDIHRKEYTRLFVENRLEIPLNQIPEKVKEAFLAVEDTRFYERSSGIDLRAIFRAIWVNIQGGAYLEGGSTITQQLARSVLLTQKKTLTRKIQEIFLALSIERNYTKSEILERYLNQICFGHGAYGIETASRLFFGKSVTQIQLHQIALLAGLPKNPTGYSPYNHPEAAKGRRSIVLDLMVKYNSITPSEAAAAKNMPLDVIPLAGPKRKAPYFVDYIIRLLKGTIDEEALYTAGYKIYTTIDPLAQEAAEEAIASFTDGKPDTKGILQPQLALVAMDPRNGYIKAMVGGRDYANTQLNRVDLSPRQSGSTIKPFVYTAAIDSRLYTPSTIMMDEELEFATPQGPYKPRNYDGIFRGEITLRAALEQSINIIAIKLVDDLGASRVVKYARQMGLKNLVLSTNSVNNDLNLSSLALGGLTKGVTPLELTAAYSPFANQGIYSEPMAVLEVKDGFGNTIFSANPHKQIAIPAATAYLVTDMMKGVILRGTGMQANIGRPAAGKTGTTSDNNDAWFVGFTPDLLAGVWMGNDIKQNPNQSPIGSGRAARIWRIFMEKALSQTPPSEFIPPAGIVSGIEICAQSGEMATPYCPETAYESFLEGTQPTTPCHLHENGGEILPDGTPTPEGQGGTGTKTPVPQKKVVVRICSESGMLATDFCPESQVTTEIFVQGEEPTAYCNKHTGN
ncbi:MAG: PBP1A family penicillin-binding protein [Firmicutes bacterium]|nr:PBP1A family penicillin-binding protein [Bacillota bacterium]